ncbi:hypothetical protein FQZ97_294120 [compost metagenome]
MPGRGYVRACRRPLLAARGSNVMRWAVTAHRSDGPAHAANNMGESLILLRAAYMMIPLYTDRAVAKTDGLRTSAPPPAQVPASAGPSGRNPSRYAQAPAAYRPYPWAEPSSSACTYPFLRPRCTVPRSYGLCATHRTPAAFLIPLTYRRTHRRLQPVHPARPPSGLPAGSKTDASFEALVSPEHHALALTGSRLASWHQH